MLCKKISENWEEKKKLLYLKMFKFFSHSDLSYALITLKINCSFMRKLYTLEILSSTILL